MSAPLAAPAGLLPAVQPPTILVVDDDAAMCMILGVTLRGFGYGVLVAEDGEEALRAARAHPEIRVVLLDVVMRGLSGKELADQLGINLPNAAVVLCSGHPPEMMKLHGFDLASFHFIQKPCQPRELRQKLEELMALSKNLSSRTDFVEIEPQE